MTPSNAPVVVGIDGSDGALDAARWAGAVAQRFGAPLRIVHALPSIGRNLTQTAAAFTAAMMSYQRDMAEAFLKAADEAVRAERPELSVSTVSFNEPADQVLIDASADARLVVLGGKKVTPAAALLLGSTALSVATRAACPVVAFRGDNVAPGEGSVVVGVDDSPAAQAALELGFEFADRFGLGVDAVRSLSLAAPAETGVTIPLLIDWDGVESAELADLTETVDVHNKRHPDVDAKCFIEPDSPGKALLKHVTDAGLVVVGSRGRNALAGVLLGSTSLNLLHHSPVPVMICRAAREGDSHE
ncbi:universal stress protein [Mycolicibacterium conceptionense]|uniref:Universal stress protein n=3 Tax=Mycolicibacterium TaxID=1866885 RepID=A0A0J8UF34_9MYCO|nr:MULTISPECIES: universal stress protein [Mycolicibacterium]KLI06347.1 universal stress protein [Mycolicibacterium senegalense]KLO53581.1 universal stress protein [Mycolicibacterium senegalense]KMV19866.1 universal stress protein [Mycolicibacterium conceptionense]MCW1825010.1 universal stress protein [Mycolicibacterium senegalense]OBB15425.1 universal stress protein [Mycolicibacterium conceptionense]